MEVSLTGQLGGGFYHGFFLFGKADMRPCSQPIFKWLLTRVVVGEIPLNSSSSDPGAIAEFEQLAQKLKSKGLPVRVTGILRAKPFFLSFCLSEDDCFGNGYFSKYPAMLELHAIQLLGRLTP